MNHKNQLFVTEYVRSGNATQAAIAAGYSERSARNIGHKLMTKDDILQEIELLQESIRKESQIDIKELVSRISRLSVTTKSDKTKLQAYDMLMKHLGGYMNELSIINKMSDDDLDKLASKMCSKIP